VKTIVYATDFSSNSIDAFKYALELSSRVKANLSVIHVFDISSLSSDLNAPYLLPRDETYKYKKATLQKFCSDHMDKKYGLKKINTEVVENDSIIKGIISKSKEVNASVIITGMKGKNIFEEFIMGSTTKQLIEKAPCAVLAVPEKNALNKLETIVYATDFEQEDIIAISKLIKLFKPFKPKIKITHISTKNEYDGQLQMEWFKEILLQKIPYDNLEFDLFYSDDIFEILNIYLKEVNADLVAMLERKQIGFLKKLFHKDLVKRMESQTKIPLLSFNEANYK